MVRHATALSAVHSLQRRLDKATDRNRKRSSEFQEPQQHRPPNPCGTLRPAAAPSNNIYRPTGYEGTGYRMLRSRDNRSEFVVERAGGLADTPDMGPIW